MTDQPKTDQPRTDQPRTDPPSRSPDLGVLLERHFGFPEFRPGQREVIEALLGGHSAAAVFPTGGGKSLCYQLPALELPGLTLVISPLIALMKDQIDALRARGHRAARLDSSLDVDEYRAILESLRQGDLRLLYVAPERFNNERFRELLRPLRLSLFAVDEAHCISEWGHNFRPDYLKLAEIAREQQAERVLALTATATAPVLEDICRRFEIEPQHAIRTTFYRSNLTLQLTPTSAAARDDLLEQRLREREPGRTIVYVTRQRTAERLAERICKGPRAARAYHAGMSAEQRERAQNWFMASEHAIVVATIAFGMGIDKEDIRYVYHYNLAKSLENYSQEIGRAGRDGKPSICESLVSIDDCSALENFVYGDTPTAAAIHRFVDFVFQPPTDDADADAPLDLSLYELAQRCDLRPLVARTLLTYLELDGSLRGGTPYYSSFQFVPHASSQEILARFEPDEASFLRGVLRHARKARKWFTLDVDAAGQSTDSSRERVVAALEKLESLDLLELRAQGVRHRYWRLRFPAQPEALVAELFERCNRRELAEIGRLHQMLDLVTADRCQSSMLAEHFAEQLGRNCGHCSWCLGGHHAAELPPRAEPPMPAAVWSQLEGLVVEHPEPLGEPRARTRFLVGVTTPALTKAKLSSHPLFGVFVEVPFARVLEQAKKS